MTSVAERLDKRIDVLTRIINGEEFLDARGQPIAVKPPISLNKCREWDDSALGIERIGDPASFTREHQRHGSKIKQIDALLKRMPRIRKRGRTMTATAENADLRARLKNAEDLIVKLTGQLAVAGEEVRAERALRVDSERVIAQSRERERRANQRRGAAALTLVAAEGRDA